MSNLRIKSANIRFPVTAARGRATSGLSGDRLQQVGYFRLAEVPGPAERRGPVALVANVRVGPQLQQLPGQSQIAPLGRDVQGGLPGLIARDVATPERVDIEP